MKAGLIVACVFLAGTRLITAADSDYPLPAWGAGERTKMEKEGWLAGADLLTEEPRKTGAETTTEDVTGETDAPVLDELEPAPEEPAHLNPTTHELPETFWADYFAKKPQSFLVDPQKLLTTTEAGERLGFLNYHAGDSAIDLYVYLFKGDQEIPGEVREEELIERCYSEGRPAAVVFYFMSAPQSSVLYLSPSLTDAIPTSEQRRTLEGAIMQALSKNDPSSQLEGFLVQMSIRLYWLERRLGGAEPATSAVASSAVRPKKVEKKSHLAEALMPWLERAKPLATQGALAAGSLLVGALLIWLLRLRRSYRFPDFEVEPRLGGPHAAGVGAVISFATATLPPASQKNQLPDHLRRG